MFTSSGTFNERNVTGGTMSRTSASSGPARYSDGESIRFVTMCRRSMRKRSRLVSASARRSISSTGNYAAKHVPLVFFTDIVGSTDMTRRLGDEMAMTILELHNRIARAALSATGGREVKHTGDGIMAVFFSAAAAVRCGIKVQNDLSQHRKEHPDQALQVRIGVAAGEPIERHNDFFGSAVQLAARLCANAEPEQILMSNAVAELCIGKALPLKDFGSVELKGFDVPVHVHCVAFD